MRKTLCVSLRHHIHYLCSTQLHLIITEEICVKITRNSFTFENSSYPVQVSGKWVSNKTGTEHVPGPPDNVTPCVSIDLSQVQTQDIWYLNLPNEGVPVNSNAKQKLNVLTYFHQSPPIHDEQWTVTRVVTQFNHVPKNNTFYCSLRRIFKDSLQRRKNYLVLEICSLLTSCGSDWWPE